MRKLFLFLLVSICLSVQSNAYSDHRFHNVDSLETVMAGWTAADIAAAGETELKSVAHDLSDLMYGFVNTNSVKCEYYARMLLGISERMDWHESVQSAAKVIGQIFWAKEKYDSAAFYYGLAMDSIEKMPLVEDGADGFDTFTQKDKDDVLSLMYGTLGNLYSIQDSTDLAMEYYSKAGALFDKYGWNSSNSVLYGNMGATMREAGRFKEAEEYALKGLEYARLTGDSLLVAGSCKGLGGLYLDAGKTNKAIRFLNEANQYFADHEDEELLNRVESLDYTQQVLALQKKRMLAIILLLVAVLVLGGAIVHSQKKQKRTARENSEFSEVLEETIDAITPVRAGAEPALKPREKEIVDLISKGYTNADVASALGLSQETIKWYKKKLFATFGASNSAELVRIVTDRKLF